MKKKDIVSLVAERTYVSRNDVDLVYDEIFEVFAEELVKGNNVLVSGFGGFRVSDRAPRRGVNPRTGEIVNVSHRKVVSFKAGLPLKDRVNGKDKVA